MAGLQYAKNASRRNVSVTNRFARSDGPVSKAEYAVFAALSQTPTAQGMTTQDTIILRMTKPDFAWLEKRKLVYLDGIQCHSKDKAIENDAEIDTLLERKGFDVLRISYTPPLNGKELKKVVSQIKCFVGDI